MGDGTGLAVTYAANQVHVTRALLGDANLDQFVGQADLDAVLLNFGSTTGIWSLGDFNGDAFIGQADLDIVLLNFGDTAPPDLSNLQAIPEPSSLGLMGLGVAALARRRRPVAG